MNEQSESKSGLSGEREGNNNDGALSEGEGEDVSRQEGATEGSTGSWQHWTVQGE